jgi:hypothetical protein
MAALRLKDIAHQAVTATFLLWVAQVETPEHWYLSGVRCHGLNETPKKHHEEKVEGNQHQHNRYRLGGSRSPQRDVGVVDEAHDSADKEYKNVSEYFSWTDW